MYGYAGNNPVTYSDPTGQWVINFTNRYIIARLENELALEDGNSVDTLIIPPMSIAYGAFDGEKDASGNFFKVTAKDSLVEKSPFFIVDFIIVGEYMFICGNKSGALDIVGDLCKIGGDIRDCVSAVINGEKLPDTPLLSGIYKERTPDYNRLADKWNGRIKEDGYSDPATWSTQYYDEKQTGIRRSGKYRIQSFSFFAPFIWCNGND